jgi:hypothetical protein
MAGRPIGGGAGTVVSAASGTGSFVAIPGHATGFYLHASAASFVDVRGNNTADTLDATDAAPVAAGVLYGPFQIAMGRDKFIAVAGNGGAATVTITFVT